MKSLIVATLVLFSGSVFAAECALTITRDACPGKEVESYSKCNGAKTCDVVKEVASVQECQAFAVENCKNQRFDITQYKHIVARFNRASVDANKDFCDRDAAGYVVAANFPFRGRPDCR